MARRLQLGAPTGVDQESRWRWIENSLRTIERASHEENLGGIGEALALITSPLAVSTGPDRINDTIGFLNSTTQLGNQMALYDVAGMAVLAGGTVTTGSTSLEVDLSATGYDVFRLFKLSIRANAAGSAAVPWVRLSDDGGLTFESDANDYSWARTAGGAAGTVSTGSTGDTEIELSVAQTSGEWGVYEITIHRPQSTAPCHITWNGSIRSSSIDFVAPHGGGRLNASTPVTDISFQFSTGTWGGDYTLIGIK